MPNWKTHLELAKKVNDFLQYDDLSFDAFLFGSILPDINNSYVVTNIKEKISHSITHFKDENNKTYVNFGNKYKKEIESKNPLFLGYFFHLYLDYSFNNYFYTKKRDNLKIDEHNIVREIKQHDFKLFNNNFISNHLKINNIDELLKEIRNIEEVSIKKEDIIEVIKFLDKHELYNGEYKVFTPGELNCLLESAVNNVLDWLKK
jgi:hypothetical protein